MPDPAARMLTSSDAVTSDSSPAVQSWQRQGSTKQQSQSPQIKAEGRVGRLGGMRLEPTRVSAGIAQSNQNPHETLRTSSEAISIRWRPVFPPGPLPQTSGDLRRVDWSQKLAAYSLCAFACRERVEGATAALYTFLKRRTGRAVAFVQNLATRAQLDHPIGYWPGRGVRTRARGV